MGPIAREERYVLAVEALEHEVNNGGYEQWFINTRTEFLDVTGEALHAIGCPSTAAITDDAIHALRLRAPITDATLEERLSDDDSLRAELGACDERYYTSDEAIADRLFRWIELNPLLVRVGDA